MTNAHYSTFTAFITFITLTSLHQPTKQIKPKTDILWFKKGVDELHRDSGE